MVCCLQYDTSKELEISRLENESLKREMKDLKKALEEREIKVLIFSFVICTQKKALCNFSRYKHHDIYMHSITLHYLIIFHIYVTLNKVMLNINHVTYWQCSFRRKCNPCSATVTETERRSFNSVVMSIVIRFEHSHQF